MASVDRIDSIYDVAAIKKQQSEVAAIVNETIATIKQAREQSIGLNVNTKTFDDYNKQVKTLQTTMVSLNNSVNNVTAATIKNTQANDQANGTLEQNIELRRRLQKTLESYNQDQKEDLALLKNGTITRAQYNQRLTESQTKIAIYKQKLQELNRVIKEDIALEGRAGDAYKQLSAEYNRAALAAKNYQITLGKLDPVTIAAVAKAKQLSDQLKAVDAAVGTNTRNVGNYSNAITSAAGKAFGVIRKLAYILPGIGIAGIFSLIGEGIGKAIDSIGLFNTRLEDTVRTRKILDTVTEESAADIAKESTNLNFLRATIESTEVPMATRLQAIKDLRELFPDYFKDLSDEELLTGQVAGAYDLAAAAIIRRARASAANSEIEKNALKELKIAQEELADVEETNAKLRDKSGKATVDEFGNVIDVAKQTNTLLKDAFNKRAATRAQERADIKKDNDFLLKIAVQGADALIKIDKEKEKKAKKPKKERDLGEANRKAEFEILKANLELNKEFDLLRFNDEKKTFEDRLSNLINYGADSRKLIEETAKFELGNAKLTAKEREKIENDKNNALIRLSQEVADKLAKATKDQFKVDTSGITSGIKGLPKEIQKALDDYAEFQKKIIKEHEEGLKKLKKDTNDAIKALATELEGLFFDIFTNHIENQKNAVQDQIDALEKQKQKDIEVVNQSILNAQDKADAIAIIEARAAAKKQQLELKQRQLDQQKARFEKARAVAEIIQSTSIAVVNALTQVKTLGPGAIALAALIGAIGAVQIARTLAQPIPRYAEGTEGHPGGLAVVGDGGRAEGIQLPDGSIYKSPSKDTVVDLPKGTKVYKDYSNMPKIYQVGAVDTTQELKQGFGQVVMAIKHIPQPIIKSERAWTLAHRTGSTFRSYLNTRL